MFKTQIKVNKMRKTVEVRKLIVKDRESGMTYQQIADKYEISIGGARKIYEKFKVLGTCETFHAGGKVSKITEHDTRRIRKKVGAEPMSSARMIIEDLDLNVSVSTMRRKLRSMGLKNYVAKKRPMISQINRKKRLAFAKKYINMPLTF